MFVDHAEALGGAEHSLLALMAHLDRDRVEPLLATRSGALADAARAGGVPVAVLPLAKLRRHPLAPFRLARGALALRRLVLRAEAAIVHANVVRAAAYASVGTPTGRALVWHVRDLLGSSLLTRRLCRVSAAVVAISRAALERLPCSAEARLIYNPVSLRPARPLSRAELGLPIEGALVAQVSRLRPWKGQRDFLRAAALVKDPRARFLIVGGRIFRDGEARGYEAELHQLAAELGLAERVSFLGQREDLADIWPHVAIAVHCATAEPFGRSVAEAQLAGVPVVAYAEGGVPEIVVAGKSGLLVPPASPTALAAGIDALLAEPDRRERMGRLGALHVGRLCNPERHASAVTAIYTQLAGPR